MDSLSDDAKRELIKSANAAADTRRMNPTKPDVVDTAEIARRLGVERDTVHRWRQRYVRLKRGQPVTRYFPDPDYDLDVGPVWLWKTVKKWGVATGRINKA